MRAASAMVLALVLGSGCTYTVRLLSKPEGAVVLLPDGSEVLTPAQATFRHGQRQLVRVEAPGYRPLVVDIQRTEGPLLRYIGGAVFQKGGREITFLLVDEHPLTGGDLPEPQP